MQNPSPNRLDGKTAIIVGGGQTPSEGEKKLLGNGRAIAELFASQGAKICVVDRILERAELTVAAIQADGGSAFALEVDITDYDQCETMVKTAQDKWGHIDILVNNVGIGGGDGPAHKLEQKALARIFNVNFNGAWHAAKAVLPIMRAQENGAIVNISSLASIAGGFQMAYETSKAAMNRMTTHIAQANAKRGVRCNAITMGLMDTPMAVEGIAKARGVDIETIRTERGARVPLRRQMGSAMDTANAALFLASDEAGFITGVILPVDGGASTRIG